MPIHLPFLVSNPTHLQDGVFAETKIKEPKAREIISIIIAIKLAVFFIWQLRSTVLLF